MFDLQKVLKNMEHPHLANFMNFTDSSPSLRTSLHESCKLENAPGGGPLVRDRSFSDVYELGEMLGQGSFGQVFSCTEKATGEECACKLVTHALSRSTAAIDARKEISIMLALKNVDPGLIQIKEVQYSMAGMPYMVMEKCKGGDLFELLKRHGPLPEPASKLLFRQLASALHACHVRGVVHRDIKPENVLLDRPAPELFYAARTSDTLPHVQAKLADFGIAAVLPGGRCTTGIVGSKQYLAPEVVLGLQYGFKADIWSLGVVLYAMLSGRLPFSAANGEQNLFAAIARARISFNHKAWDKVSKEAKDLVLWLLKSDAAKRPTAAEALLHPWAQDKPKPTPLPLPLLSPLPSPRSMPFAMEVYCI